MSTITAPTPAGVSPRRASRRSVLAWAGYAAVLLVLGIFAVASPHFATPGNLGAVLTQATVFAVAGIGLATVIATGGDDVLTGGIDLSIGAVCGLAGTIAAVVTASGAPAGTAVLVSLAAAAVIGIANGAAVVAGLRPLLATLATMGIATSLELVVSGNVKTALEAAPFLWLREGSVLGIPAAVLVLLVIGALAWWALDRTPFGVNSYAVGDNATAAAVAGLNPNRYRFASYVISSLLGGAAGILLASRLSAAVPGIGAQVLLDIILVAYMSAVFSRRLVVNVPGTVVAAVFVAGLTNGLTLLGVASQWTGAAKGALILLVLAVVALRGRNSR